jgi:hydroxymethylpyrimidine pyrophosphatase-like HAD family hydrolase
MEAAKEIKMFPISNNVKENKDTGFISIYRSIKKHWLWKENRIKTPFEAWIDLLLRASHDDQKEPIGIDFIVVNRGQVLTSQLQLSKEWFWSRKKVTNFLKVLEKDQMIVVKTTTKWSMITICNYASYQSVRTTKEHQKNNKGTSKEHIQPLEPFNNSSTPPAKPDYKYSHNGFFDRQLEKYAGQPELGKYQKLIEFLHEKDEEGNYKFGNVLSLEKQISYQDYIQLKAVEQSVGNRTLKSVLEGMEDRKTLKKDHKNVYLTAKNWLKMEFKK